MGAALLSPPDLARRLAEITGWELKGKTIERRLRFPDFRAAMAFVNRVAELADAKDHHPDIVVHYNLVTLTLWTHVAGGLTERDFALADEIDRLG